VQALSLCNSCGVDEVESFVWQAGRTAQGEYKPQLVKQILLLGVNILIIDLCCSLGFEMN
jgi:hypothetical protein